MMMGFILVKYISFYRVGWYILGLTNKGKLIMLKDKNVKYLFCCGSLKSVVNLRETKCFLIDDIDGAKYKKEKNKERLQIGKVAQNTESFTHSSIYALDSDFAIGHLGKSALSIDHPNKAYIEKRYQELQFIKKTQIALEKLIRRTSGDYEACLSLNDRLNLGVTHEPEQKVL